MAVRSEVMSGELLRACFLPYKGRRGTEEHAFSVARWVGSVGIRREANRVYGRLRADEIALRTRRTVRFSIPRRSWVGVRGYLRRMWRWLKRR